MLLSMMNPPWIYDTQDADPYPLGSTPCWCTLAPVGNIVQ